MHKYIGIRIYKHEFEANDDKLDTAFRKFGMRSIHISVARRKMSNYFNNLYSHLPFGTLYIDPQDGYIKFTRSNNQYYSLITPYILRNMSTSELESRVATARAMYRRNTRNSRDSLRGLSGELLVDGIDTNSIRAQSDAIEPLSHDDLLNAVTYLDTHTPYKKPRKRARKKVKQPLSRAIIAKNIADILKKDTDVAELDKNVLATIFKMTKKFTYHQFNFEYMMNHSVYEPRRENNHRVDVPTQASPYGEIFTHGAWTASFS